MDLFPKFIIEDNSLILSKVTHHKELVTNEDNVKGGGWFKFNNETNTFTFYGDSHDFGKATLEDIQQCIKLGNIYKNKLKTYCIADKHHFAYDTGTEIINLSALES